MIRISLLLAAACCVPASPIAVRAEEARPEAVLTLNVSQPGLAISPFICSGDQELAHLGWAWTKESMDLYWECFGGSKTPTIAEVSDGFSDAVIAPLKDLNLPLVRYKGFHRLPRSWRESITIVDWAVEFCRRIGAEVLFDFPWLPRDLGDADLTGAGELKTNYLRKDDLVALVGYCNSADVSEGMGKLRADRGHVQPYNVRYWNVGDESWHFSKHYHPNKDYTAQYARDLADWIPAMRAASPIPITVGADLSRWQPEWNKTVIDFAGNHIDFGGDHVVFPGGEAPKGIASGMAYTATPLQLARWIDDIQLLVDEAKAGGKIEKDRSVRWGQTEYEIMRDPFDSGTSLWDCEFQSIMTMAVELQVLMQKNALVACYHEAVGGRPWGIVEGDGKKLGQYHLLDLVINNFGSRLLDFSTENMPTYDVPAFGQLMEPAKSVPLLAVCAAQASNGDLCFFAINRDSQRSLPLRIKVESYSSGPTVNGRAWTLTAPKMTSPPEEMSMTKEQISLDNEENDRDGIGVVYDFPASSITVLRLSGTRST